MNIGITLRNIRKRKGLSQQDLALKANISRTYISQIEKGECNPTIDILDSICKVLEIPFPILSFLSLDIKSIPENKREDYLKIEPAIIAMIEKFFIDGETKN
jgi:transcriptional regulator with XRE-family HTH domain